MSQDDVYTRSRSRQRRPDSPPMVRDYSPDYYSGGAVYASPYASGALPAHPAGPPPPRFPSSSLQVPSAPQRPRSVPPLSTAVVRRGRSRSHSRSRSRSRSRSSSRPRTPIAKAKQVAKENFTHTTPGLGVSLLGAIVGGLAAREASDASARRQNRKLSNPDDRPRSSRDRERTKMISTIAGAVIGGLGANALEKRFEVARERDREQQEAWERRWGREEDLPHYDTGDRREEDHGFGSGRGRDRDRDRRWREDDYEDDDYVYDVRASRRNKSADPHRYRN